MMRTNVEQRVVNVAEYVLSTGHTVRGAAKVFGVSKSTIHIDLTQRLPTVRPQEAQAVRGVLNINKSERHIRGGQATKQKWHDICVPF